jgi:hypothetical protein
MEVLMAKLKTLFETQTCTRCHGTGKHSYCERFRDVCFKCQGDGITLTKRGQAAQAYYIASCTIPVTQVKVGDVIQTTGLTHGAVAYKYRAVVTEITEGVSGARRIVNDVVQPADPVLVLKTKNPKFGEQTSSMPLDAKIRVYRADDTTRLENALEYQSTLTKVGKVRQKKTKGVFGRYPGF